MAELKNQPIESDEPAKTVGPGAGDLLPKNALAEMPPRAKDDAVLHKLELFDSSKNLTTPEQHKDLLDRLSKIDALPNTGTVKEGEGIKGFAQNAIKSRVGLTKEFSDDKAVEKEAKRILDLNGKTENEVKAGDELKVYAPGDKANLRKTAADKMAPIIGQELKEMGMVTEKQLDEAHNHEKDKKKTNPQYKIGDAIVDKGFATRAQVEEAFGRQNQKKAEFNAVLEDYNKKKKN